MAIVSSCIGSVTPLGDIDQPVGVQGLSHPVPWPPRPGAHLVEGVRLEKCRVTLIRGDRPMKLLEIPPVLWSDAVEGQDGKLVPLMLYVAPGVTVILAEQAGRIVFGVTLDEHHIRTPHFTGRHTPPDCL